MKFGLGRPAQHEGSKKSEIDDAHDIALIVQQKSAPLIKIVAKDSLSRIWRWLRKSELKLTEVTDRRVFQMPQIEIDRRSTEFSSKLKYLGLKLDTKLTLALRNETC